MAEAAGEEVQPTSEKQINDVAFKFWRDTLGSPRHIVAPMVDQSELPWRILCRRYGANLVYSPMYNAGVFLKDANWRKQCLATCPEDRPLIVQFCANTVEAFVQAGRHAQDMCDAVDLNLGCPQQIAKRGHYGSFLQDEWELLHSIVSAASRELSVPVTCKVRIFPEVEKTVRYAQMLESAGCQLLTVHGRLREQKGHKTGLASWEHIRAVKAGVGIPVVANGNIRYLRDVESCVAETGVDGVMAAEGNLTNPALFTGKMPVVWRMAGEYLELVRQYPADTSSVRAHLFRLWHKCLPLHTDLRTELAAAQDLAELADVSRRLTERVQAAAAAVAAAAAAAAATAAGGDGDGGGGCLGADVEEMAEQVTDGGDVEVWRCQPFVRPTLPQPGAEKREHGDDDDGTGVVKPKKIKRPGNKHKGGNPGVSREVRKSAAFRSKFQPCTECTGNPKGQRCSQDRCKACCKVFSARNVLDCEGHRFKFKSRALRLEQAALEAGSSGDGLVAATSNGDSLAPVSADTAPVEAEEPMSIGDALASDSNTPAEAMS